MNQSQLISVAQTDELATDLMEYLADPMWADHVEFPKATLQHILDTIRALANAVAHPRSYSPE